jgi:protein-S-isoprenylcysteine O-methyltransferase Ste14
MKTPGIVIWTIAKVTMVLFVGGWCALWLRRFDRYLPLAPPASGRPFGIALMTVGGFLVLTCGAILSTRGIGERGHRLFPREFVAFGPFRYVRNPMSFGVVALLCGLGLLERSLSLLLFAALLLLVLHVVVVVLEEPGLEKRFGNSYRSYKQSVNRWLPWYRRKIVERA